ncbi:MAG: glycoside hydrolase family 97 catalytic domain-containing protein [Niastella sp.]|nr:glycoside hydrolase family 97 catalytic domain-containing protein [Niastella sp.]
MIKYLPVLLCGLIGLLPKTGIAQVVISDIISSPDKTTICELINDGQGKLMYRVSYQQKPVISLSPLGLIINDVPLSGKTVVERVTPKQVREKISWPLGEDAVIPNEYNEITVACHAGQIRYHLIIRAYNGSVALRYVLPAQANISKGVIRAEQTAFHLSTPATLYQYNHESVFTPTAIDTFSRTSDLPTTLTSEGLYISIGEADNTGYTKAELKKGEAPNSLVIDFKRDSVVAFNGNYQTPWRTISFSSTAIGLHSHSQLYLKLTTPSTFKKIPAWIKPGKLIRAQLTTQSGLDCIDFAAAHQFQYIMFDAGWYGAEFRSTSDPTQYIEAIDMPKVIAYGKQKGIGVILYVNYVGLRAKLDTILPLYKKWGVAGLKFGFVDGLTQQGITWLAAAMKKVQGHGFILNIHDNYKPTGLSRTFPALLTQEGIRGDENSPDAFHNTTLPFTRFLAGPADFTFCFPNPGNSFSKNIKVSKAQQLALTVVYFSPLQAIFWYGKPTDYTNEDEIEFFKYVPTVWDESHYFKGEIGKYISVARRKGNTWFIGNAAGPEDWQDTLVLDFLKAGKAYTATIYEDDEQGGIRKRTISVKQNDEFPIAIKSKGGQAIIIQ